MTRFSRAAIALMLTTTGAAAQSQTGTGLPAIDGNKNAVQLGVVTLPDGRLSPKYVVVSPLTGLAYTVTNGQPLSPAVTAGYPVSRSVALTGSSQVVMPAATTTPRKAGYCQLSFSATGMIAMSVTGTAAAPPNVGNDVELVAGQSFDLNQHGYAEQGAVTAYGTHAGDVLMCQEVQ